MFTSLGYAFSFVVVLAGVLGSVGLSVRVGCGTSVHGGMLRRGRVWGHVEVVGCRCKSARNFKVWNAAKAPAS